MLISSKAYSFAGVNIINTLLYEYTFLSIFEVYPKTGFHRLPTHIRGPHRNFFP